MAVPDLVLALGGNLFGMVKRVITTLEDDLDGSEANETITFSIDNAEYEIDLNDAHADELREVIGRYTAVARKTAGRPRPARRVIAGAGGGNDTKVVRAWAIENGILVSARGRIQADVMERYAAAH
jgi:hypothetical protein